MPNVLSDSLKAGRTVFLAKCFGTLLWMGGYAFLFSVSWKAALGVFLVEWGVAVTRG